MKHRSWLMGLTLCLTLVACGDSTGGDTNQGGSAGDGGSASGGSGEAGAPGAGGGGGDSTPAAPILDEVVPMHGALHLYWTNVATDCDAVEGERSEDGGAFASFFSIPGTVDNEADDAATDPAVTYTYRVRCLRGTETSEYSNELSGSPTP